MLAWTFEVVAGPYKGRKAFLNTSLQKQSLWTLKRVLRALGYGSEELAGKVDFDPESAIGRECTIVVSHERYEDVVRQRIRQVLPADASEVESEEL